jgi:Domain of unknown function (DUF5060)
MLQGEIVDRRFMPDRLGCCQGGTMGLRPALTSVAVTFAIALTLVSCSGRPLPADVFVTALSNPESVPCYGILELSFQHNGSYDNSFFDVTIEAVFTTPSGAQRRISGFYYGDEVWKVRFRPDEPGRWTYTYVMTSMAGLYTQGAGAFDSAPSDLEGPVLRHPENSYRWVLANGKPYFPVGLQGCIHARGARLPNMLIDAETRPARSRQNSPDEYFAVYSQAGFNLFRFSQRNCSHSLYDDLDHYREAESLATDQLLATARERGFRIMFGLFGNHDKWISGSRLVRPLKRLLRKGLETRQEAIMTPDDYAIIAKEKRFIDYAVARWGVYVDFWELLNERKASDEWATLMAEHLRSVDPDHKPIGISWEKPHLPAIDLNTPHWYESEGELQSDLRVQQQAVKWKQEGKPVIVGEQGNRGMNWDPLSSLRMRLRTWTALFQEVSLIFWNTSWSKTGMFYGGPRPEAAANIYLGPEERGFIRVLQDFASHLDAGMRMTLVEVSSPDLVRAYGLLSSTAAAVYLHHFDNHVTAVRGVQITLDLPVSAGSYGTLVGNWIEPSSGDLLARVQVPPGRQTLDMPPLLVDLALLVTSEPDRLHLRRAGFDPTSPVHEGGTP